MNTSNHIDHIFWKQLEKNTKKNECFCSWQLPGSGFGFGFWRFFLLQMFHQLSGARVHEVVRILRATTWD